MSKRDEIETEVEVHEERETEVEVHEESETEAEVQEKIEEVKNMSSEERNVDIKNTEEQQETRVQYIKRKRKILKGKITRAIRRLSEKMDASELVKRLAEKELSDVRKNVDEAIELNSELYEEGIDEKKLDKWESDLLRDLHTLEIRVEDHFCDKPIQVKRRNTGTSTAVRSSIECSDSEELDNEQQSGVSEHSKVITEKKSVVKGVPCIKPVDDWIDELIEFQETVRVRSNIELSLAEVLYRLEASRDIQPIKLKPFDGNPLKYVEFIEGFRIHIHDKENLTDDLRMVQLKMVLEGDAARSVSGLGSAGVMYATAMKTIKRLYGQRSVIARAFIDRLTKGEKIRNNDRQFLRAFSIDIITTLATLKRIDFLSDINATETLRQVVKRFPDFLIPRWKSKATELREKEVRPDLQSISDFINGAVRAEFDPDFGDIERHGRERHDNTNFKRSERKSVSSTQNRSFFCCICGENHKVPNCQKFLGSSVNERINLIRDNKLCYSCLNKGHITKDCRLKKMCGKNDCTRTHHVLIHIDPPRASGASSILDQNSIMPVVRVRFRSANGRVREGNVLIDGGAGTTIIRKDFANMLGLQGRREGLEISVVGGQRHGSKDSRRVKCWISPLTGGDEFAIEAHELDKTVLSVPPLDREWLSSFKHLRDITFSHKAGPIDLILGVQYSHLHAEQEVREGVPYEPVGKKTRLGWCVIGADSLPAESIQVNFCRKIEEPCIERLYDMETIGVRAPNCECPTNAMSQKEKAALTLMESSCRKVGERYQIGLPWMKDRSELPNNFMQAEKRLFSLEKSLSKDQRKAELYRETMSGYIENGWAEEIVQNTEDVIVYYLPHHGVYRVDKPSTPLRVVFDPACSFEGQTLNSYFYKGPNLLGDLFAILLRFREKPVAFHGDISKMFLQILLPEEDTHVHRFLWRDLDVSIKPKVYRLKRVTFGDKPSPDMANFVMLKMADTHKDSEPKAAEILRKDRYMDDILHSCDSPQQVQELTHGIDRVLDSGSFKIKKWYVTAEHDTQHWTDLTELSSDNCEERVKTLGVYWCHVSDTLHFRVDMQISGILTKRIVLSRLSMIYDPLGLATITTIRARIAMQRLWKDKLAWDDKLSSEVSQEWTELFQDLEGLNAISVERCLKEGALQSNPELHVFCDASQDAYGACAYLSSTFEEKRLLFLLASKARVAPLKQSTIPRLELMGALLASRLARTIYNELREKPEVYLWTDSQVVLRWINSESTTKKAFVGVRIAEIQSEWDIQRWRHVPSKSNPADDLSRGAKVSEIKERWFYGPDFLQNPATGWPDQPDWQDKETENDAENRTTKYVCSTVEKPSNGEKPFMNCEEYSSWSRLIGVTAYCFRFVNNLRKTHEKRILNQCLSPEEKKKAEAFWIREAQKHIYDWRKTCVQLSPFQEDGIIRAGGRVKHSPLNFDQIYPVLLPGSHHVSKLILRDVHHSVFHAGVERTLSESRRRYWIIQGRNSVKQMIRKCTVCRKMRQPAHSTLMGDLPGERLMLFSPPYSTTGVDLFGPFYLKYGRNKKIKAWGALFTCATIRAVHLEIVESLSTDSFLHALRRFVSHHGWPSVFISDNGTSFVGTCRELRKLVQEGRTRIEDFCIQHDVRWIFTTPLSPHQGGFYESMVKQAKRAIKVSIGQQTLSWNEMTTVFSEVEGLLNSRPLGYCSNDPDDLQPLTPNHFMIGRASIHVPQGPFNESSSLGKRFGFVQTIVSQFWKRFIREYIPTLMQRTKWKSENRQMRVGDIVIVVDYQAPRGKWTLARVIEVYPGKDNVVRNVKLKTQFGEYKRSVQKCCLILENDT